MNPMKTLSLCLAMTLSAAVQPVSATLLSPVDVSTNEENRLFYQNLEHEVLLSPELALDASLNHENTMDIEVALDPLPDDYTNLILPSDEMLETEELTDVVDDLVDTEVLTDVFDDLVDTEVLTDVFDDLVDTEVFTDVFDDLVDTEDFTEDFSHDYDGLLDWNVPTDSTPTPDDWTQGEEESYVFPMVEYSDLGSDHWLAPYVSYLESLGAMTGFSDDSFRPDYSLNYLECALLFSSNFYGESLDFNLELEEGLWWYPYIDTCLQMGLFDNTVLSYLMEEQGQITAEDALTTVTRYELSVILMNMLQIHGGEPLSTEQLDMMAETLDDDIPWYYQSPVATALFYGFVSDRGEGEFEGETSVSRGEFAVVLHSILLGDHATLAQSQYFRPNFPLLPITVMPTQVYDLPVAPIYQVYGTPASSPLNGVDFLRSTIRPNGSSSYVSYNGIYVSNWNAEQSPISSADLTKSANMQLVVGLEAPQVLIYHSHATESYYPDHNYNNDNSKNVTAVGEAMAEVFREAGIAVIHDKTHHNLINGFNASYETSYETVNYYLDLYPSIELILDVHRDGVASGSLPLQMVSQQGDEYVAQVMLLVGSNSNIYSHPTWESNFALALQIQRSLLQYGDFPREITVRAGRFNQHLSTGNILVEVGNYGNTLAQAVAAGKLFAQAVAADMATIPTWENVVEPLVQGRLSVETVRDLPTLPELSSDVALFDGMEMLQHTIDCATCCS